MTFSAEAGTVIDWCSEKASRSSGRAIRCKEPRSAVVLLMVSRVCGMKSSLSVSERSARSETGMDSLSEASEAGSSVLCRSLEVDSPFGASFASSVAFSSSSFSSSPEDESVSSRASRSTCDFDQKSSHTALLLKHT